MIDRLEALAGAWSGEMVLHSMPGFPSGARLTAFYRAELDLAASVIVARELRKWGRRTVYRSLAVLGCGDQERYTLHTFDTSASGVQVAVGGWDGGSLLLEQSTSGGSVRLSYAGGDAHLFFRMSKSGGDGIWSPALECRFERCGQ